MVFFLSVSWTILGNGQYSSSSFVSEKVLHITQCMLSSWSVSWTVLGNGQHAHCSSSFLSITTIIEIIIIDKSISRIAFWWPNNHCFWMSKPNNISYNYNYYSYLFLNIVLTSYMCLQCILAKTTVTTRPSSPECP